MAEKIDMALDDIIKMEGISGRRKQGPNRRGRANTGFQNRNRVVKSKLRSPRQAPFKRAARIPDKWQHDMFEGPSRGGSHLLVSNLDYGVSDTDICELFAEFGNLAKAAVHYDRSGRSLGTADVVFVNKGDAIAAMQHYNGMSLDGRPMKITLVPGGPSRGSFGGATRGQNKFGGRGRQRGGRGGGFAGGRNLSGYGRRRAPRKTMTAKELDAELDTYVRRLDK